MKLTSLPLALLEWIYPARCVFCRCLCPDGLCEACQEELPWVLEQTQPIIAPLRYTGKARLALQRYKFNGYALYDRMLGKLIAQAVRDATLPPLDCCSFVPCSRLRIRKRGYDQAKRLCKAAAKELGLPRRRYLVKRHIRSQTKMAGAEARCENVRNAFTVTGRPTGQAILLIDDIYTTGATMRECRETLLAAGAGAVYCAAAAIAARNESDNPHTKSKTSQTPT